MLEKKHGLQLPKQQRLQQTSDRDCSVPVFAALTGLSDDEIRRDLPNAALGQVSVSEWMAWLHEKGRNPLKRDGCLTDFLPCAHLVATHEPRDRSDFHWIYRDSDGDVHDPSPVVAAMPADDPRMKNLTDYHHCELTLSVENPR